MDTLGRLDDTVGRVDAGLTRLYRRLDLLLFLVGCLWGTTLTGLTALWILLDLIRDRLHRNLVVLRWLVACNLAATLLVLLRVWTAGCCTRQRRRHEGLPRTTGSRSKRQRVACAPVRISIHTSIRAWR